MATKGPRQKVGAIEISCGQWLEVEAEGGRCTTILRALLTVAHLGRHPLFGPPVSLAVPTLRQSQSEVWRFTAHGLLALQIIHMV